MEEKKSEQPTMIFQLKKSPCFGECPVFVFQLFNNQTAFYRGLRFVDRLGDYTTTLSDEDFSKLNEMINAKKMAQLDNEYIDRRILDLPSTIITFKDKKIEYHHHLAPEELLNTTKSIELIMNSLQWKETLPANKS